MDYAASQPQEYRSRLRGPVLIIGSGLLGASIGLALRALGIETVLDDTSDEALDTAVSIGAGRALNSADNNGPAPESSPFEPQLVVVAVPPEATASVVSRSLSDWPQSVIVDVASVKDAIIADVIVQESGQGQNTLSRYVGTHPMAGRERQGAAAARRNLFLSKPWVIVPTENAGIVMSSPEAVQVAEQLALDCNANVMRMNSLVHDQAVALVSHAPQVVSSLIAARLSYASEEALQLAGQGLRDVTRIAASDPQLWAQILRANADFLLSVLTAIRDDLDTVVASLRTAHSSVGAPEVAQLMAAGQAGQARIPGKHGGVPTKAFTTIQVLIDDTVGQLSALLADVEGVGANIEDLRMEHTQGRPVGVVEISVLPAKAAQVVATLEAADQGSRVWKVLR